MDSDIITFNPLNIFRVLRQTLSFLDPCHLRHCRLVHSTWNHEAVLLLREKDCLHFHSVKSFIKFNDAFTIVGDNALSTAKKLLPYKSCIFGSELMDPESPDFIAFHTDALSFLRNFGKYFTAIHLTLGGSGSGAVRNLLRNILCQWVINLETLSLLLKEGPFDFFMDFDIDGFELIKLRNLHVQWVGYNKAQQTLDMSVFFSPILAYCSNLKTISCKMPTFLKHDNSGVLVHSDLNQQLFESILSWGENYVPSRRNSLEIQVLLKTTDKKLKSLTRYIHHNLRIAYLELDRFVTNDSLLAFLTKFNSLQSIYIEFPILSENGLNTFLNNVPCIQMIDLMQMTIVNYEGHFNFLNYFPRLKILEIKEAKGIPKFKAVRNHSLSSFKLSSKVFIVHKSFGLDLLSSFPNLREVTLQKVDNTTLQDVFRNLTQLTSLHVTGKEISDEAFCGESNKILRVLLESAAELPSKSLWNFQPRYPNIGNLEYLQYCSIEADLITDACLVFGVSRCTKLKRLEIRPNLELITHFGFTSLLQLQDLEYLKIHVRNSGWASLKQLQNEIKSTHTHLLYDHVK